MPTALSRLASSRALRAVLAARWAVVAALAATMAFADLGQEVVDLNLFVDAGNRLLSGDWAQTFADPEVQAGPIFLAVYGTLGHLAAAVGLEVATLACFVVELAVALGALWTVRHLRQHLGRAPSPAAELTVGVLVVLWNISSGAFVDGHPAQAVVPMLWLCAGVDQRAGRTVRAGLLVGLSAGWETWGVLGVPVLLGAPRPRQVLRAAGVSVATVAGLFAPFVLFGAVRTAEFVWHVTARAPLGPWLTTGADVTWTMRLVQGLAALGFGTAVGFGLRRRGELVWAVPVAVLVIRLLLDPVNYGYYWLAPQLVVVVAAGTLTRHGDRMAAFLVLGCYPLCAAGLFGERPALAVGVASLVAAAAWSSTRAAVAGSQATPTERFAPAPAAHEQAAVPAL